MVDAVTASWTLISENCTEKCQNTIDRFFTGTSPTGTFLVPDVAVFLQLHIPFSIKLAHRFYGMELGHTKCSELLFYCCFNSHVPGDCHWS